MTQLMPDPVDHWLDLDVQVPRKPLRVEMQDAFDQASRTPAGIDRAGWTGVGTGYAVAFGLFTREALDKARLVPGVRIVNPLETHQFRDEEEAWASGVLYGYKQGTSELPDAYECTDCGQRLVESLDDSQRCVHGVFCDDHTADWHKGLPAWENCLLDGDL